jgi:hypothetical protein
MHPIERLRYVARASGADPSVLVRESAIALADVVRVEPVGLVPACRRLIDRHVTAAPIWWLAARMLTASDPDKAAWLAADEVEADPTAGLLAAALPDSATVTIVGWPDVTAAALRRRGDLELLVTEACGDGAALVRRLLDVDVDAQTVPDAGVGGAAVVSDLVCLEAMAAGPSGVLAATGSHAAAAVAAHMGIPVWVVAGVGRVLPERLWDTLLQRLDESDEEPWDRPVELVPASLLSHLVGPDGEVVASEGLGRTTCPVAPELLRNAG